MQMRSINMHGIMSKLALVLAATAVLSGPAAAQDSFGPQELVQQAELIFDGIVTSVQYRMSDVGTPDDVALPHTFVTFAIQQTFKGQAQSGRSITLRFQGGPDGKGSALVIPGIPLFDVGERSILFVRRNGNDLCPLVGWEQGRLRVID